MKICLEVNGISIKIILVDNHQLLREGLKTLLNQQPDMKVIAEADNGQEGLELVRKMSPQVVVMDVIMPNFNGIEATQRIRKEKKDVKVLALSVHSDIRYVVEMLRAGASGYILKDCAFNDLADSIRGIMKGEICLSPAISGKIVDDYLGFIGQEQGHAIAPSLTAREREVLQLIAEGKGTREIAEMLHLSTKTVEAHRQNIMKKLDIKTVAELTKYALREGITYLDT